MSKRKTTEAPGGIPSHITVTDTLDLHGFFPERVAEIVEAFIQNALELRLPRLRIIHGKGKSRLKFEVIQALKASPHVVAFHDAPLDSGGWGATVVEITSEKR
jgi:DNA mismatch repair protein MutS2